MAQKIRVFKLAGDFGVDNETMVAKIQEMGIEVRNYMSALDPEVAQRVRRQIERERTEDTVEEHIRPTVVRRRSRSGSPVKPQKKRPPKVEAETPAEESVVAKAVPAKPKLKAPTKRKPKVVAVPEPEVVAVPEPEVVAVPEPKVVAVPEPKVVAVPKPEVVAVPEPEVVPVPEPKVVAVPEPEVVAVPEPEVVAVPEPEVVAIPEPEVVAVPEPVVEPETKVDSNAKGVQVATGPAVRRPANQAPVIRRRIVNMPSSQKTSQRPSRSARPQGQQGQQQRPQGGPPGQTQPPQPQMPPPDAATAKRQSRASRKRREVDGRAISGQGQGRPRFAGGGPSPSGRKRRMAPGKKGKKTELTTPKASKRVIRIEEQITVQELAKRMGIKSTELLMKLMSMGVGTININSTLDADTAKIVASEFEYDVENVAVAEDDLLASTRAEYSEEELSKRISRPPVVTMMGHVDHGKTSLLDAIRKSNITSGEAGGITQHIGAYRVKAAGQTIAFIDTPGHAAFTAMRARGANVTDIVVLLAAADDGVMPQTIEAINHAKAAEVPIIVAINKCDLPGADPDRTRRMLMEQNLIPEELGGDIQMINVSAITGEGIDKLLESIALQSEMMELTHNPERSASGVVLESYLDRGRGPVANVLVQDGTLEPGKIMVAGAAFGKIRALTDEHGRKLKIANASTPVEVLGLSTVPIAGEQFDVVENMRLAEKVSKSRVDKTKATGSAALSKPSLEALYEQMQSTEQVELKVIIKTDVQGTVEAIRDTLEKLSTDKVKVVTVHASPGGITESDVLLASTAGAIIIGFNVRPAGKARGMADQQGVQILTFSIIYEVVDAIKAAMLGLLTPDTKEEVIGQVEVRNTFTIPKIGTIAGSYVTDGKVERNALARLFRDSVQVWQGRIGSVRRFKDDVKEVSSGFECGLSLAGYNDVKVGDVIEVYQEKQVEATL